jgi:predicted amidohydrolase
MFNTGYHTNDVKLAETMGGTTVEWMKSLSSAKSIAICGSFLCSEEELITNRFVLVSDGEVVGFYDKTHLFSPAQEEEHISAGNTKADMVFQGFKIRPIVCYDLRFPYTAFNDTEYDVLINVASWPSQRIAHWDTLLKARAIENQAYVLGCNRVGEQDGHYYPGHSSAYSPNGDQVVHSVKEEIISLILSKSEVEEVRTKMPFLKDRRM